MAEGLKIEKPQFPKVTWLKFDILLIHYRLNDYMITSI